MYPESVPTKKIPPTPPLQEKFVFPVSLCVTRLSGTGPDCVFLGVVRPMPTSITNVRVWVAPTGVILCTDQQFSTVCGIPGRGWGGGGIPGGCGGGQGGTGLFS